MKDLIAAIETRLEPADGEGMPEVHEPGAGFAWLTRNASCLHYRMEGFGHDGVRELAAAAGDKQVRIVAGDSPPPVEVALQGHPGCVVQREQSAFLELAFPDEDSSRSDIAELERPSFRATHPRGSEQTKQGAVGRGPQRIQGTELPRVSHNALDFRLAKDIGGRLLAPPTEEGLRGGSHAAGSPRA